jgi:cytoskeletal protein CcmA (bactofilin family)
MPASQPEKILFTCPHCGHSQREPRSAISTNCRKCGRHFRIQDVLTPAAKPVERAQVTRRLTCFDCQTELEVAPSAESTMCKRCGRYMDLKDYVITNAVSKNFKTKGSFVVEPKGYIFNTEVFAGDAVIKGRFLGKLFVERSLTIHSTAEIKGSFKTNQLVIPAENHFRWPEPIKVVSAEIAGELAVNLHAEQTIVLKSTARMFGDVEAGGLVVEAGAVVVGRVRVGAKKS